MCFKIRRSKKFRITYSFAFNNFSNISTPADAIEQHAHTYVCAQNHREKQKSRKTQCMSEIGLLAMARNSCAGEETTQKAQLYLRRKLKIDRASVM